MARRRVSPSLTTALAATLTLAGCGAKTGLRVPDVPQDHVDVVDVPDAPRPICVDVDPDAGVVTVNLETQPQVSIADVFFIVDRTGSMEQEIDNIKSNLQTTIVPGIAATIRDVQFGVATYSDFPLDPYGDSGDIPFTLVSPIDRSVANVQGAVNSIRVGGGGDSPEAMTEALYQVATGEGYAPWITPRQSCAVPGRAGYGCLRPNAQPIFILVGDAPGHNGPDTRNQYSAATFTNPPGCPSSLPNCRATRAPHTYDETVRALNAINARVIGISSGGAATNDQCPASGDSSGCRDMERIARDTSTVGANDRPLIFTIGSNGLNLDNRVVAAVQTFTRQVRFNAAARVVDVDPQRPVRALVRAVRPLFASPMTSVQRVDGTTFYGVVPGTRLTFSIDLVANIPRMRVPQRFPARVEFLADGRPNLGSQDFEIVIPADDGSGCEAPPDAGSVSDASVPMDAP